MQRPTGVTVLAILCFIGAAFLLMGGLLSFAGGGLMAAALRSSLPPGVVAGVAGVIGVIFLVIAALYFITGYGLWALKPWGRMLTIILTSLALFFGVLGLLGGMLHFAIFLVMWRIFWCAVDVLVLWYMFTPEVKRAFGEGVAAPSPA
jgi:hypothetical protein